MGNPMLLLRLEGPLQSWGLRSRWDVRDTGDDPSKSGVIGLLGCALGYPVGDPRLQELDRALTMGVREEHPGTRIIDFQTVTGVNPTAEGKLRGSQEDPDTIVSPRAYLQDASFLVVLAGPAALLEQCRDALLAPRWPIYLGRKSCPPVRPVLDGLTEAYGSVRDALERHPWEWGGWLDKQPYPWKLRTVEEDDVGAAVRADRVRTNPARMYATRLVKPDWVDFPNPGTEGVSSCS